MTREYSDLDFTVVISKNRIGQCESSPISRNKRPLRYTVKIRRWRLNCNCKTKVKKNYSSSKQDGKRFAIPCTAKGEGNFFSPADFQD